MKLKAGTSIVSVAFVEKEEELAESEEQTETIDIQDSIEPAGDEE